jgi:acyl-CoA synthetase (NDP forming)
MIARRRSSRAETTEPAIRADAQKKDIEGLLNPRNVALVGASDRSEHWSRRVWDNLRRFGFDGGVFPVNPKRTEIWGGPCFASFDTMPEPPDHLAIFTPAAVTLDVLRRGASAGARSATIYAAGFGEGSGIERARLARELRAFLNDSGMTAVGPNCMGVGSAKSRFTTIPDETLQEFAPSPVAVVSQSGAMSTSINRAINALGHKVALLVSCGNQIGCTVGDVVDYCADQADLRVILCYIESLPDPDRFLNAARRARQNGKAVVTIKIGRSEAARASALTHTGALAGSAAVFDVFASAAGIIRCASLEDAVEAVEFLACSPLPRGDGIALMSISGALRSLMIEAADRTGARLARFTDVTRKALANVLGTADVDNPVDTKRTLPSEQYASCLEILTKAPEVDVLLVAEELPLAEGVERRVSNLRVLRHVALRARESGKPVAMFMPLTVGLSEYGQRVRDGMPHVPVLRETEKMLRAVQAIGRAGACRLHAGDFFASPSRSEHAQKWRQRAAKLAGPTTLNEVESKQLLHGYGIASPPERSVETVAEAERAARDIGFPVVLKAVCGAISHKSDAGLVILGICDVDAVRDGVAKLAARCKALGPRLDGILVAQQMSGGIETALGIARDPEMGPAVMFGMGGTRIELFKDVSFAPPFLDHVQAAAMVEATCVGRLLAGYRGSAPGDRAALSDALVKIGRLARELGDIIEAVDINPFLVRKAGEGAFALDALVVLRPPEEPMTSGYGMNPP